MRFVYRMGIGYCITGRRHMIRIEGQRETDGIRGLILDSSSA